MSYRVTVIRSRRKTAAIQIAAPGEVTLRLPLRYPQSGIPALLESHRDWIEKHMRKLETQTAEEKALPPLSAEEIRRLAPEKYAELTEMTKARPAP